MSNETDQAGKNSGGFDSLNPFDVISEKEHGTAHCDHPGNRNFERLVWNNIPLWEASGSAIEKEYIYESIVGSIRQDRGRFLEFRNEWRPPQRRGRKVSCQRNDDDNMAPDQAEDAVRWVLKAMSQEEAQELVKDSLIRLASLLVKRSAIPLQESASSFDAPMIGTLVSFDENEPDEIVSVISSNTSDFLSLSGDIESLIETMLRKEDFSEESLSPIPVVCPLLPRPQLRWTFSPIQLQNRNRTQKKRKRSNIDSNNTTHRVKYQRLEVKIENSDQQEEEGLSRLDECVAEVSLEHTEPLVTPPEDAASGEPESLRNIVTPIPGLVKEGGYGMQTAKIKVQGNLSPTVPDYALSSGSAMESTGRGDLHMKAPLRSSKRLLSGKQRSEPPCTSPRRSRRLRSLFVTPSKVRPCIKGGSS